MGCGRSGPDPAVGSRQLLPLGSGAGHPVRSRQTLWSGARPCSPCLQADTTSAQGTAPQGCTSSQTACSPGPSPRGAQGRPSCLRLADSEGPFQLRVPSGIGRASSVHLLLTLPFLLPSPSGPLPVNLRGPLSASQSAFWCPDFRQESPSQWPEFMWKPTESSLPVGLPEQRCHVSRGQIERKRENPPRLRMNEKVLQMSFTL